jgi:hypothetical protein
MTGIADEKMENDENSATASSFTAPTNPTLLPANHLPSLQLTDDEIDMIINDILLATPAQGNQLNLSGAQQPPLAPPPNSHTPSTQRHPWFDT